MTAIIKIRFSDRAGPAHLTLALGRYTPLRWSEGPTLSDFEFAGETEDTIMLMLRVGESCRKMKIKAEVLICSVGGMRSTELSSVDAKGEVVSVYEGSLVVCRTFESLDLYRAFDASDHASVGAVLSWLVEADHSGPAGVSEALCMAGLFSDGNEGLIPAVGMPEAESLSKSLPMVISEAGKHKMRCDFAARALAVCERMIISGGIASGGGFKAI